MDLGLDCSKWLDLEINHKWGERNWGKGHTLVYVIPPLYCMSLEWCLICSGALNKYLCQKNDVGSWRRWLRFLAGSHVWLRPLKEGKWAELLVHTRLQTALLSCLLSKTLHKYSKWHFINEKENRAWECVKYCDWAVFNLVFLLAF